jgi:uncharacterized protein YrrD
MQYKKNANIINSNGEKIGEMDRFVIDPKTGQVTHLVVSKGFFFKVDKILPIEMIQSTSEDADDIQLTGHIENLDELQDYMETDYISIDPTDQNQPHHQMDRATPMYWYPSVGATPPTAIGLGHWGWSAPPVGAAFPTEVQTEENIPEGTVALQEGAKVIDREGDSVGNVEKVITTKDDHITHMVITKGMFDSTKKLIPANWIDEIKEDGIKLSVTSGVVDRLKDYED